mmetsp:Transcript_124964/g.361482  ORF Transcript_124964/g.361482 Transcript_124964/m.361482 type:complete len:201 (-) Transcript_124964:44-646(-)
MAATAAAAAAAVTAVAAAAAAARRQQQQLRRPAAVAYRRRRHLGGRPGDGLPAHNLRRRRRVCPGVREEPEQVARVDADCIVDHLHRCGLARRHPGNGAGSARGLREAALLLRLARDEAMEILVLGGLLRCHFPRQPASSTRRIAEASNKRSGGSEHPHRRQQLRPSDPGRRQALVLDQSARSAKRRRELRRDRHHLRTT